MSFSDEVKKEIIKSVSQQPCCKMAGLYAFIKGAGTLIVEKGKIGFSLSADNREILGLYVGYLYSLYGIKPLISFTKKKIKAKFLSEKTINVLQDVGIIDCQEGTTVNFAIDKYIIENDCCKREFLKSLFLAVGDVSLPSENTKSGYHLEFVFSNYVFASDFCEFLASFDLISKTVERNSTTVVYFNSAKEIIDLLYLLDAKKSMVEIKDLFREREVSNNINRQMNCEMSNISKQVNASIAQRNAIDLIEKTIGLQALKEELVVVCVARKDNPESTLEELADKLKISKSCLNHRLRKIMEISKNLQ